MRKQPCKHPGQQRRRRSGDSAAAWGEEQSRAGTLQGAQAAAGKYLVFSDRNCGPRRTHTGTGVKCKEGRESVRSGGLTITLHPLAACAVQGSAGSRGVRSESSL